MSWVFATGGVVPRPTAGKIDVTPLVTVLIALLVVRFVLGVRLRWPVVSVVVLVGAALGLAIEAWGVVMPSAVAFIGAVIVTGPSRRGHGRPASA